MSASVVIDAVDDSAVSRKCAAVVKGVVVSVNDSVDVSDLASFVSVVVSVITSASTVSTTSTVVVSAVVGSSTSVVTFSVPSVVCTGKTVLFISFSLTATVEGSSTTMLVVAFAILGMFTLVVALARRSAGSGSGCFAAGITGSSIVISVVTSTASAVLSASLAVDIANASEVSSPGVTVVSGAVISVSDRVDPSVLASVLTLKSFCVTFVPTLTSSGNDVAVTVGAAVGTFVVSTTCFSVVVWTVVGSPASLVTFSVSSVICTRGSVLTV